MKIIKRNGAEVEFDREKIKAAIVRANEATDGTPELSARQIDYISLVIEDHCRDERTRLRDLGIKWTFGSRDEKERR